MTACCNDIHFLALRKNARYMLLGQSGRVVVQAVYFFVMARTLGAHQYGVFAAVIAAVAIASPFVGLGSGNLMVRNVARNSWLLPECLGHALLMTGISGFVLTLIVVPVCLVMLPSVIPVSVIILVTISDLFVYRFLDVAVLGFQSLDRLDWTALLNVFASVTRLAGVVFVALLRRPTIAVWSWAYLATSGVCALVALYCVGTRVCCPNFGGLRHLLSESREGCWFSISLFTQTVYNDIDKAMLAQLSSLDAVGIYAAAYRLIDVAFQPVRALLSAAYASFFRSGKDGIRGSLHLSRRLLPAPVAYSIVTCFALVIAAPVVPRILGGEYSRTSDALRWLSLLPLLRTLHYFAADALTGAGLQLLRTAAQITVAAFNVLLNLYLLPRYSWRGAAWSSLASDGLLAITLWSCACLRLRSARNPAGANPEIARTLNAESA